MGSKRKKLLDRRGRKGKSPFPRRVPQQNAGKRILFWKKEGQSLCNLGQLSQLSPPGGPKSGVRGSECPCPLDACTPNLRRKWEQKIDLSKRQKKRKKRVGPWPEVAKIQPLSAVKRGIKQGKGVSGKTMEKVFTSPLSSQEEGRKQAIARSRKEKQARISRKKKKRGNRKKMLLLVEVGERAEYRGGKAVEEEERTPAT